jgi:hypothetical protein
MRKLSAAVLVTLLIVTGSSASAVHRSVNRTDPREDAFVDVWRTRKIPLHRRPPRVLFKLYALLGPDWEVSVFVDSRGGPRADYRLWNFEDLGTSGCGGRRLFGREIDLRCGRRLIGVSATGTLWWDVPRAELNPGKRIRWRIHTHYQGAPDNRDDDLAPDSGWYP